MKKNKSIIRLALIIPLWGCLSLINLGCQGDAKGKADPVVTKKIISTPATKNREQFGNEASASQAPPSKQARSEQQAYKQNRLPYDPNGKLDPFKPLFKEEVQAKADKAEKSRKPERPRTPLERLDLGQLRLTAVVFSEVRPQAMVEEDTGKGYVVGIGTPIGLERGQVTEIKRDRIVIEHLKTDDFGNSATSRRELKLLKPVGD